MSCPTPPYAPRSAGRMGRAWMSKYPPATLPFLLITFSLAAKKPIKSSVAHFRFRSSNSKSNYAHISVSIHSQTLHIHSNNINISNKKGICTVP